MERAFLVSTGSLERSGLLARVEALLGDRNAGSYANCREHTPKSTVMEAAAALMNSGADAILALGGGSVVDTVKAAAHEVFLRNDRFLPSVAIPTTLSVSEFTPFAGVLDEETHDKSSITDLRCIPHLIFLDPEVVEQTPRELWLGTGLKALDHALEAIWAVRPHPISTILARESVEKLIRYLPDSVNTTGNGRLNALYQCQLGAWLGVSACLNTGGRLSHTLGHQIGGHWGVAHGETSCIVLPHVMKFLAPSTLEQQQCIADIFDIEPALGPEHRIELAAEKLSRFIASLELPTRLRQTTADKTSRASVAELRHQPLTSEQLTEQEVSALLALMW
jgi:alcohol dehydrogenase